MLHDSKAVKASQAGGRSPFNLLRLIMADETGCTVIGAHNYEGYI